MEATHEWDVKSEGLSFNEDFCNESTHVSAIDEIYTTPAQLMNSDTCSISMDSAFATLPIS